MPTTRTLARFVLTKLKRCSKKVPLAAIAFGAVAFLGLTTTPESLAHPQGLDKQKLEAERRARQDQIEYERRQRRAEIERERRIRRAEIEEERARRRFLIELERAERRAQIEFHRFSNRIDCRDQ